MAPQPPLRVYEALTRAGASTVQALGIMANVINESGFDPEAVGDNGTSFGIVQQHGNYSSLVTGNDARDLQAQVTTIARNGGFAAASGATPAEAAGNFAANYEKCVGCQPGGEQFNSRVSNAAKVAAWQSSGSWPKSAGSATAAGSSSTGGTGPGCIMANPFSTNLPLIGNVSAGPSCLFSTSQARALIGGLMLVPALVMGLTGAVLLVALGFRRAAPGAGRAAETVGAGLAFVPGLEGAGLAVAGAGAAAQRSAPQSIARRRARREAGRTETAELEQRGASDLRTARRPQNRAAVRPGRVTRSIPASAADDAPPF
jgi:hypothetical protein